MQNAVFIAAAQNTYSIGRQNNPIDHIIIHAMDGTIASTDSVFTSGSRGTSAHFGIEDNKVHSYVNLGNTAYHAGDWPMNLRSIGIEHSADPTRPASEATYDTSAALIFQLCRQFTIPIDRDHIKMHREVSDSPTACPVNVDIDILMSKVKALEVVVMDRDDIIEGYWTGVHRRYDQGQVTDVEINGSIGKKPSDFLGAMHTSPEWLTENDILLRAYPLALQQIAQLNQKVQQLQSSPTVAEIATLQQEAAAMQATINALPGATK